MPCPIYSMGTHLLWVLLDMNSLQGRFCSDMKNRVIKSGGGRGGDLF